MAKQAGILKVFFKYLKNNKGQGLVEIGAVVFFSLIIGLGAREAGLLDALYDTYSDKVVIALGPSGIIASETNASGNQASGTNTGDGTSGSGSGTSGSGSGTSGSGSGTSGSGSGTSGSGSGDSGSGSGDSGSGSGTSGSGNGDSGSGSGTSGSGNGDSGSGGQGNEGGNSGSGNTGIPAGGSTGGESGNTGSGNTFEEKKAALEAQLKASAVASGTTESSQLGAIVNVNGAYKINVGQGWSDFVDYRIVDVNEVLKSSSDGKHISLNGGDIVIADDGNAYFCRWSHGWIAYPEDLKAQTSNCARVRL